MEARKRRGKKEGKGTKKLVRENRENDTQEIRKNNYQRKRSFGRQRLEITSTIVGKNSRIEMEGEGKWKKMEEV